MSLDITLEVISRHEVFAGNITHNLVPMAKKVGLYYVLWRPDELGIKDAGDLIDCLGNGLVLLKSDPERFKKLNPTNGWGDYELLVKFCEDYLEQCKTHPDARIRVDS